MNMTMTDKIKHHLGDDILMAYSAGTLPEAFSLMVATHISLCDTCRAQLETFDAVGGAMLEEDAVIFGNSQDLMTQETHVTSAEAMDDCSVVFHTASPFRLGVRNPQKELVDPARLGTRNVLETVSDTPTVKRVVLTSSCAAIFGDNADLADTPNGIFTEEIWNTSSSTCAGSGPA